MSATETNRPSLSKRLMSRIMGLSTTTWFVILVTCASLAFLNTASRSAGRITVVGWPFVYVQLGELTFFQDAEETVEPQWLAANIAIGLALVVLSASTWQRHVSELRLRFTIRNILFLTGAVGGTLASLQAQFRIAEMLVGFSLGVVVVAAGLSTLAVWDVVGCIFDHNYHRSNESRP